MMINKFGGYLYHKTQPDRLQAAPSVSPTEFFPDKYKSICYIALKLNHQEGKSFYLFENSLQEYKFLIHGKIENINLNPKKAPLLFTINNENPLPFSRLIGINIKKGDIIRVHRDGSKVPTKSVFLEVSLLCPLIYKN